MIDRHRWVEIQNWTSNLLADIKRLREAEGDTEAVFEAFDDVEHDFEKLRETVESIEEDES